MIAIGSCEHLDFDLELRIFVGRGNTGGRTHPALRRARAHLRLLPRQRLARALRTEGFRRADASMGTVIDYRGREELRALLASEYAALWRLLAESGAGRE